MLPKTRLATAHDMPALDELMPEFYAESACVLDRRWAAASFAALLADDTRGAIFVALDDGVPARYIVLTPRCSMEHSGLGAFIEDLFVRPGSRRRGAGRRALQTFFAECARRNVLAVHVEVGHDNAAAKALYGRFGLHDRQRKLLTARLADADSTW